jgi:predicted HTH transcriptional regulator
MTSLAGRLHLRESVELEAKLALGPDGKGAIPRDFWPTYSAFANTHGGVILLGVRESRGSFSVEGVPDIGKMRTDLFNLLNSRDKISVNLLSDEDVLEIELDGKSILQVTIPAAGRKNNAGAPARQSLWEHLPPLARRRSSVRRRNGPSPDRRTGP